MRKILLLLAIFISASTYAQSKNCSQLLRAIKSEAVLESTEYCIGSSMIVKVEYYNYEGEGFVIAYIKSIDYDISGRPYLYCGISNSKWNSFKMDGIYGSWGKSFNKHIADNKCNCN